MTAGSVGEKYDSFLLILDKWRWHCPQNWNPHCGLVLNCAHGWWFFIDIWTLKFARHQDFAWQETPYNETKLSPFHCLLWFPVAVAVVLCHCYSVEMEPNSFLSSVEEENGNEILLFCFISRQKMSERPKRRAKKQSGWRRKRKSNILNEQCVEFMKSIQDLWINRKSGWRHHYILIRSFPSVPTSQHSTATNQATKRLQNVCSGEDQMGPSGTHKIEIMAFCIDIGRSTRAAFHIYSVSGRSSFRHKIENNCLARKTNKPL